MKIILDAMGGDNAPGSVVRGALDAIDAFDDITVALVGRKEEISRELFGQTYEKNRIEVVAASEVIEMCDSPAAAIRKKKDSSMVVGLSMLSRKEGDIFISAGNTGALVAGGTLIVRRIKGVKRPAIATQIPTRTGSVLLIDAGANADCKPSYLAQFGVMGSVYMKQVMQIDDPGVGLVNIGEEAEKGNMLTQAAYGLMEKAPIRFAGNAEGRDLLSGRYDVIVCDGYTGNIILKFLEGTADVIMGTLKQSILKSTLSKIGALFMKSAFRDLKKKFDYTEYGGALLLGLSGGVMKAHGSSDSKAITSAVIMARKFILGGVVDAISKSVERAGDFDDREEL